MAAHGTFNWNELMTRNVGKAKKFYGDSLGWTFEDMAMGEMYGTYTIARVGDQMVAGMFDISGDMFKGQPETWFTYVAVDDLDQRLAKAKKAGGKVLREPWDVPGIGKIAIIADPNGVTQGWMVPDPDGGM